MYKYQAFRIIEVLETFRRDSPFFDIRQQDVGLTWNTPGHIDRSKLVRTIPHAIEVPMDMNRK